MMKLSPLDIQHQEFSSQAFGYNRNQVRAYLEQVSKVFTTQIAELNHLQQELLDKAEEVERLKLREYSFEKAHTPSSTNNETSTKNGKSANNGQVDTTNNRISQKELSKLKTETEQNIALQKQKFLTEIAKEKANARQELRELRENILSNLRTEREKLAEEINLLRKLRDRSVQHMQTIQQQTNVLLNFFEDTNDLNPPAELLAYLNGSEGVTSSHTAVATTQLSQKDSDNDADIFVIDEMIDHPNENDTNTIPTENNPVSNLKTSPSPKSNYSKNPLPAQGKVRYASLLDAINGKEAPAKTEPVKTEPVKTMDKKKMIQSLKIPRSFTKDSTTDSKQPTANDTSSDETIIEIADTIKQVKITK